ncbi:hypothetical protein [Synechococcus sp. HK01-R]|uniref:hypothetical protein n=1 Tax=Synechococcus sp. HK01-R TaxID=2751171 RepID=UPI001627D30B|nr:hypothetical protein [Synechococcus sp. HK01-R]QNG26113.1 hypothetical protein H0O21_07310 [Synechococcus sp. HK01-R]
MEDWDFIEQGELRSSRCASVCITCQHFRYSCDQHCRTLLACGLRQRLLPQGDHLTRTCSLWAPTWQQQAGWAPEVA